MRKAPKHDPMRGLFLALVALLVSTWGPSPGRANGDAHDELKVLFVGNSYTRFNDLPSMVERVAASVPGGPRIFATVSAHPGKGMRFHWRRGEAAWLLRHRRFTHVVLQGHSLASVHWPERFAHHVQRFDEIIRRRDARTVLFATWARHPSSRLYRKDAQVSEPLDMQIRIDDVYGDTARRLGAELAPVGDAFFFARSRWPRLRLHHSDGSHPRLAGTYLAACVLYGTLTGGDPHDVRYVPRGVWRSAAARLRSIAASTLSQDAESRALALRSSDDASTARRR